MGLLNLYGCFVTNNPGKILAGGAVSILLLFILTLLLHSPPSFKDPLVGFEARDTPISSRINTWKLLLDETSPIANNLSVSTDRDRFTSINHNDLVTISNDTTPEPPLIESSLQNSRDNSSILDEDEDEYYGSINSTLDSMSTLMHYSLQSPKAFCGKLYEGYAQVVIVPSYKHSSSGLFNLNSMHAICQLDKRLRLENDNENSYVFRQECEQFQPDEDITSLKDNATCCNSWSLPNVIACLHNKTSCADIDSRDMRSTEHLINLCAPHYFKNPHEDCFANPSEKTRAIHSSWDLLSSTALNIDGWSKSCKSIPDECLRCNGWIYNVAHYLTNENFIRRRGSSKLRRAGRDSLVSRLTHTNIFLPIAKSGSLMSYYSVLSNYNLRTPYAQVRAMDLGLKNSLFEHLISDDMKLFLVALLLILAVIAFYTWSPIISLTILAIICLSLCLSYSIYELIFRIPVFPFMNLLAVVISFGICSDNAMLFCKHWSLEDEKKSIAQINPTSGDNPTLGSKQELSNLEHMLKKAIISTLVAALATACSFIISAISKVIAVRCFCIFATTSVVANYLLTITLLPPALILDHRLKNYVSHFLDNKQSKLSKTFKLAQQVRDKIVDFGKTVHNRWIFYVVTQYKMYLIIVFISSLLSSSIIVFYRPTLQPSEADGIQLLSSRHTFERYNKALRRQFTFERIKSGERIASSSSFDMPDTLPIRIVFGVRPVDNGNHLDPEDHGRLEFDPKFDLTDNYTQYWLMEFCRKLRQQRFILPSPTPEVSNCFMYTFKSWMDSRSCRDPIDSSIDRSPCCQTNEFPYNNFTFNNCIIEAMHAIKRTPEFQPDLQAGPRFLRNSTKVAALVIEYKSNKLFTKSFTKMERFYDDANEWVSWHINNSAPPGLRSGWFVSSNLDLLALQIELEQSTMSSIILEVVFAMVALFIGTRDIVATVAGTLAIGTVIIMTVAILIIMQWSLGVAESILISLTIGLSIDFALHYTISFCERSKSGSSLGVIDRILTEVGSPIALATVTTSLAGLVIYWSDILAYQQLGVFLMLIATISWLTSTFFLLPMLATINSIEPIRLLHSIQ